MALWDCEQLRRGKWKCTIWKMQDLDYDGPYIEWLENALDNVVLAYIITFMHCISVYNISDLFVTFAQMF